MQRAQGWTRVRSSAASDVYKRQVQVEDPACVHCLLGEARWIRYRGRDILSNKGLNLVVSKTVSYTDLRAHETDSYLVCRLLLEKKKKNKKDTSRECNTYRP